MESRLFCSERVQLTSVSKADTASIVQWHNDSEFLRLFDTIPAFPKNEAAIEKWIEQRNSDEEVFFFGIRLPREENKLIGMVELNGVSWSNQTAWMSMAIGDRDYWSHGYGTETGRLALGYAFSELNLLFESRHYRIHLGPGQRSRYPKHHSQHGDAGIY